MRPRFQVRVLGKPLLEAERRREIDVGDEARGESNGRRGAARSDARELHSRVAQQAVAGGDAEMDETTRARLRALGYVQ
jgi:hypothetical protein